MLDEIRTAAPSPAYIATGRRPQADPGLKSLATGTPQRTEIEAGAMRIVLDSAAGTLQIQNGKQNAAWTLSVEEAACANFTQPHTGGGGSIEASGKNHWRLPLQTACGQVLLDLELLTNSLARLTLSKPESARTAGAPAGNGLHLHVAGGGPYFGLGERFWQASLSGTSLDVKPQDRNGEPGHHWTYVAVPLVYGTGGVGLYADTAFDTKFRFSQQDNSFDMETADAPVPVYLFAGDSPKDVLSAYTGLTGRPQNPPQWAFGPWITALGGRGPVLDVAQRLRAQDIPVSALWIYDQNDVANNLGWPFWFSSYYGDPRSLTDQLHGQGLKVLTYVHPYVRSEISPFFMPNPEYTQGVKQSLLVTGADGKPAGPRFENLPVGNVDFTNPAAVDWWQRTITAAVRTQGFDGWMEDFGEWVRDSDRFSAGTGHTLSELYPLLYHKITIRVAQAINPAVVPFSRSGSAGSQAFSPAMWGGDQWPEWSRDNGLPSVVTAGITAGMSGYSMWGPDILSTGSNRDLWMRWVEFGALTPLMRDHPWDKPVGSLNLFTDDATLAFFRRWAVFHSSLLPYLATYAAEASRTGIPIMRHTVLEFPDDPRSATAEYQYLLGHELLVAPVVQPGQTLRTLYLPKGEWVNFWNGDFLTGGQDVTVASGSIPLLVRAGSVLPFKPEEEAGRWNWDDPALLSTSLLWRIFPARTGNTESSFTLPNGTSAHLRQHGAGVTVDGQSKTERDYELVVRSRQQPTAVRLNGRPMAAYTPAASGRAASQWWWNSDELHVRFHAADFRCEIDGIGFEQYPD